MAPDTPTNVHVAALRTGSALLAGLLITLLAAQAVAADVTAQTRSMVASMKTVKMAPANGRLSKADKATNARAFAALDKLFDFEGFSTDCLGKSAAKFSAAQQKQFKSAMTGILRSNGYSRGGSAFRQAKITFGKATKRGKRQVVPLKLFFPKEDLSMESAFVWSASGKVVDLIIDGDSLTADTRNQVARMLKKKSPAVVISKLERKLAAAKKAIQ